MKSVPVAPVSFPLNPVYLASVAVGYQETARKVNPARDLEEEPVCGTSCRGQITVTHPPRHPPRLGLIQMGAGDWPDTPQALTIGVTGLASTRAWSAPQSPRPGTRLPKPGLFAEANRRLVFRQL